MPVLTNVKTMKRYGNERVNGVNGFAYLAANKAVNACEFNGNLVASEVAVPILSAGNLERVSANAKYGEKISFSVSKMAKTAFTFTAAPTSDLTTLVYWCNDSNFLEFNWSLNFPIEIAYCSTTQGKVGRPTGNITVYASDGIPTIPALAPNAAGLYFITYSVGGSQIAPAMATSEEGSEYDPDNGERFFRTQEIISCSGFPQMAFSDLADGGAISFS